MNRLKDEIANVGLTFGIENLMDVFQRFLE